MICDYESTLREITVASGQCLWLGAYLPELTNRVEHASDGCTLGSTLARDFYPVLSLSCEAEEPRSVGGGLQFCLDRGYLRLQLASSSPAPRARRCG